MVAEIGDLIEDTGKGAGGTVPETWRNRTTGTAQDLVVEKAVTLVRYRMKISLEAKVRKGRMVTTPTTPPHKDGYRIRGDGQKCGDGGRSP